ncbi:MAG: tRNA glutamyl-Q(34) synthetase GluQRS [Methylococcus sp.]|jgi:glutamyl-Q tRNA(Asp) synthetase
MDPVGYRGRFAPTPSGPLHLGSLVTALGSFLDARAHQGDWLVRIDDVDPYRCRPGAADQILRSLDALGLHWEGQVVYQSQLEDRYQEGLDALSKRDLLYACDCPRRGRQGPSPPAHTIYQGACREKGQSFVAGQNALRLRVGEAIIEGMDTLKGHFRVHLQEAVGDLIVYRRDQVPAYHLATVLDDAAAGITHIVRGEDLFPATPGQIHLQHLLGFATPRYAHTPLLVDGSGAKLSKRTLAEEAEIKAPTQCLRELLDYLAHPAPKDLDQASTEDILTWAIAQWSMERLTGVGPIAIATSSP